MQPVARIFSIILLSIIGVPGIGHSQIQELKQTSKLDFSENGINISAWSLYFKNNSGGVLNSETDHVVYVGQGQCGCKTAEFTYLEGSTNAIYPSIYCYEKRGHKDTRALYETLSSSFESLGKQADDCFSDYRASLSYNFAGTCGCPTGLTASIGIDGQVTCTANDGITMLKRFDGMEVHSGFLDDEGTCDSVNASCTFDENCRSPRVTRSFPSGLEVESISFCYDPQTADSSAGNIGNGEYFQSGDRTVKLSLDMDACRNAIYGKIVFPSKATQLTEDDIKIDSNGCTIGGYTVNSSGKSCSFLRNLLAHYISNTEATTESTAEPDKIRDSSPTIAIKAIKSSSDESTIASRASEIDASAPPTAAGGINLKASTSLSTTASPASSTLKIKP